MKIASTDKKDNAVSNEPNLKINAQKTMFMVRKRARENTPDKSIQNVEMNVANMQAKPEQRWPETASFKPRMQAFNNESP